MKFYQVTLFGTIDGEPCYWCGYGETEEEASRNLLSVVREDCDTEIEYESVYETVEAAHGGGFKLDCFTSIVELPGTWEAKS